ncbi:membrane protein [Neobacillus drentensis]|uniref:YczE/YyaS/YitT family protein n=1 Tax=Neobacillus drentensis TaxID=220684 RepID=UPI001F26B401|nr:membrane protein [Neobacillus drentensis]ULT59383.1 membrane protein [Neobacillus drentensis]
MHVFTIRRIFMTVIGNLCIGIAVSLLRLSHFGTDPFSTMNLGVSGFLHISFGVYQLIFNLFILIIQFIFVRNAIGFGTIVNMVGIGFISDFFVNGYHVLLGPSPLFITKIIFLLIAVVLIGIGVALYMTSDLGISPWDAMPLVIQKLSRNKIPFVLARMMADVISVVIGFSFGAIVGIATVIMAFGTGPLVQYFRKQLAEPLLRNNHAALPASVDLPK